MATSLRWLPVVDSSSRSYRPGRAEAGPHDYGGLSSAAGPGLLPLHGVETVSPEHAVAVCSDQLTWPRSGQSMAAASSSWLLTLLTVMYVCSTPPSYNRV
eukprot:COSAG01_NODE_10885_length_2060_cov_48.003570_1_plen_99_part_10